MTRPVILLTRPQDDQDNLPSVLQSMGYDVCIEPLSSIEPMAHEVVDLSTFQIVLFTSRHAVTHLNHTGNRHISVVTVGAHTAEAARQAGFSSVMAGSGRAEDLVPELRAQSGSILYARGQDISFSFEMALPGRVTDVIVYRAPLVPDFSKNGIQALTSQKIQTVLFFSRRTAEHFVTLVQKNGMEPYIKGIKALCLGAPMVESLSVLPWQHIGVSPSSGRQDLLAMLGKHKE
jgi:uroporphyrinogen-III synthase